MLQFGFGPIVTKNTRRLIGKVSKCRLWSDEQCPVFLSVFEELCASTRVERWHCGSADDSVRILRKGKVRIRSFRENI